METGLGKRLKMARRMAGLSQQDVADGVGLSRMSISKYENEQVTPDSGMLIKLAEVLGQRADLFLRGPVVPSVQPVYRGKARLKGKREKAVDAQLQEWVERYLAIESLYPESEIPRFVFYTSFWKQFSRKGWRADAPGDELPPERPRRMVRLVLRAVAEDVIGRSRAGELLGMSLRTFAEELQPEHEVDLAEETI